MFEEKDAEKEKKDAEAAKRPSVTVPVEINRPPPKKLGKGRKQEKPGQLLAVGGRFSTTVGENLNLNVQYEIHYLFLSFLLW